MVSSPAVRRELDSEPGYDTADSCWLCDRERGELCHVHDPVMREARRRLRRPQGRWRAWWRWLAEAFTSMVLLGPVGCRPPPVPQAAPPAAEVPAFEAPTPAPEEPGGRTTEVEPAEAVAVEPAPSDGEPEAEPPARPEEAGPVPAYDRREWRHWIDADHDCQNTRQEVLIEESEVPVTFKDARKCTVATGRWTCPYTGQVFVDPGKLDVDHLVPLENAHVSGGWRWDADQKRAYANDLEDSEHLVAVSASANRSKGSKGPEAWMPPDQGAWCPYLSAWIGVKGRWGLEMTEVERAGFNRGLEGCGP